MSHIRDIIRESKLKDNVSKEVAVGATKFTQYKLSEGIIEGEGRLVFSNEFFESVKESAQRWERGVINAAKVGVLVPSTLVGFTAGFGFPDKDITLLGIGSHRYWLFHSAFGVWILERLYKAYLARQNENKSILDSAARKILGVIGGGAAWGVGVHLAIDIFQPKSIVFPFFGSLVDGTLVDDRIWLLGNSAWCFKIGHDFFALGLGDDFDKVKSYIKQTFISPLQEEGNNAISGSNR